MMEGTARKKNRKEKPGMSKNYGATQSYRNTLDSNRYLTYDILRSIFQYLGARDLGSAAMVCRSWSEAANNEKSIRGPCCFSILKLRPTDPEGSPDRETLARFGLCQCHVRKSEFIFNPSEFLYQMKNIRIKPLIGFFFIPKMNNMTLHIIEDLIKKLLPEHCEAVILYCNSVEKSIVLRNDFEWPESQSLACAFLPQIPNVRIKSFKLTGHQYKNGIQKSAEYREIISTIVDHETSISNHETSTCFMLFCNFKGCMTAQLWSSAMLESKEVKIASVWGGGLEDIYVERIYKTKKRWSPRTDSERSESMDSPYCVAVLITGFIQTWSTILDTECDTKEQVEAKLKLFKDKVKLKKYSIGFMFATMWNDCEEELTIFKRLFPKVHLAGCFGLWEFGKTTTVDEVNEETNNEEKHKWKSLCSRSKSWYNEHSIVFLILTYG